MARRRKNLSEKRNEEEKVTKIFYPINPYFFLSFSSFHHYTSYPNISSSIHPLSPTPTNPPYLSLNFPLSVVSPLSPLYITPLSHGRQSSLTLLNQMDTINRLLKKQAPKRRGKIPPLDPTPNTAGGTPTSSSQITRNTTTISGGGVATMTEDGRDGEMEIPKANPVFVRWISNAKGCRVGVPTEWSGKGIKVGAVFTSSNK